MYLNNENLRDFLSKALFGNKWEAYKKFIIPRKGNFINPSQLEKTNTYAIYYIAKKEKRLVNTTNTEYYEENAVTKHFATLKTEVKVQFIGAKAEDWANSLLFWDERSDISELLMEYQSELLLGERDIITVPFQQEGYNGEMSYMASLSLITNITKDEVIQYLTDLIILEGQLKVEK